MWCDVMMLCRVMMCCDVLCGVVLWCDVMKRHGSSEADEFDFVFEANLSAI